MADGCILAHAISVRTPEDRAERMPFVHAGGRRVLLFDGRLDNRRELIAALALPACGEPRPDGAVLAAALERWGDDACMRLRGDFAFASWDMAERRLLMACDQMGGRALYYHATHDRLIVATAAQAVLGFAEVPRDLDDMALACALLGYAAAPIGRSMYAAVAMVPAAGRVVWENGRIRSDRYWRPDFTRRIRLRRDEEYVEAARELLESAVAERLRAAGPVVSHLSGGLDSAGVAATAARLTAPGLLHTVTLVHDPSAGLRREPPNYFFDEWPHAERVARRYPNIVPHRVAAVLPGIEEENDAAHHWRFGAPMRQPFSRQWFDSARPVVRETGAAVLLTGMSGNATLSYDGAYTLADRLRRLELAGLLRDLVPLLRRGWVWRLVVREYLLKHLAPHGLVHAYRRMRGRPEPWLDATPIHPDFGEAMGAEALWDTGGLDPDVRGSDRRTRLWLLEHAGYSRAQSAGRRALDGFETRDPLGDLRLVEFCAAIPNRLFLRKGDDRWLARRVLEDRLPAELIGERRLGRQNQEWFDWMSRRRGSVLEELERLERSPAASRVLDLPRLKAIAADWPADADAAQKRFSQLHNGLYRAVRVGRFIRWVEGGND